MSHVFTNESSHLLLARHHESRIHQWVIISHSSETPWVTYSPLVITSPSSETPWATYWPTSHNNSPASETPMSQNRFFQWATSEPASASLHDDLGLKMLLSIILLFSPSSHCIYAADLRSHLLQPYTFYTFPHYHLPTNIQYRIGRLIN